MDANNLYVWTMSQKLTVIDFKCWDDKASFDEIFIKKYNQNTEKFDNWIFQ